MTARRLAATLLAAILAAIIATTTTTATTRRDARRGGTEPYSPCRRQGTWDASAPFVVLADCLEV